MCNSKLFYIKMDKDGEVTLKQGFNNMDLTEPAYMAAILTYTYKTHVT